MSRPKKISSQIFCKATMKQSAIKPTPLVALIILLSVSIVDAATSHPSWGITSPSLLKRSFFHKLSDLRRRRRQVGASDAITTDGIPTGSNNANNIKNAVFCVRGGGANGPCIGIDLGTLYHIFNVTFVVHILCTYSFHSSLHILHTQQQQAQHTHA